MEIIRALGRGFGAFKSTPFNEAIDLSPEQSFSSEKILNQIFEKLYLKSSSKFKAMMTYDEIPIQNLVKHKNKYLNYIFEEYIAGLEDPNPLIRIKIKSKTKNRLVFKLYLDEMMTHHYAAVILSRMMESSLSDSLFSYRKGKTVQMALRHVDSYIRKYRKTTKVDKIKSGLYVIKKDFSSYTDKISTKEDSILFLKLEVFFKSKNLKNTKILKLIKKCLSPVIIDKSEDLQNQNQEKYEFVPTGSPISNCIANFYLKDLDHALDQIEDSLYTRFGDDILFITPNYKQFCKAEALFQSYILSHQLSVNKTKEVYLFINAAGRKSDEDKALKSTHFFDYLGARVEYASGLKLRSDKYKAFFYSLHRYVKNYNSNACLAHSNIWSKNESWLKKYVSSINEFFNLKSDGHIKYLDQIFFDISDRSYIQKIDDQVSKIVSKPLGLSMNPLLIKKGYWTLRKNYGLKKITNEKNKFFRSDKKTNH